MAVTELQLSEKINNSVTKLNDKTNELHDKVNSALKWIPTESIRKKIVDAWNRFVDLMSDIWKTLSEIVTNMGSPSTLDETSKSWNNDVGGQVSGKAGIATAGSLTVDDTWSGSAADAYRERLPLHNSALKDIQVTFTNTISTVLGEVRTAIWIFWILLATSLATLIACIIAAIASTATILGAPAGPVIAAGGVVIFAVAVAGGMLNLRSASATANNKLDQAYNTMASYPDRHWPAGTVGPDPSLGYTTQPAPA